MKKIILDEEQKGLFDDLSDENAGKLIKKVFQYVVTGEQLGIEAEIKIPFVVIANEIDKFSEQEKELSQKRSKAGKIGMQKRWKKEEVKSVIKKQTKTKAFIPPTLEEIKSYIQEKQLKINAEYFLNYFSEGNWIDSRGNKVKNWKQKLLTWDKYASPKEEKKKLQYENTKEDFELLYE